MCDAIHFVRSAILAMLLVTSWTACGPGRAAPTRQASTAPSSPSSPSPARDEVGSLETALSGSEAMAVSGIPGSTTDIPDRSPDGLVRVVSPESRGLVYVKPRPDFSRYKRVILEPVSISYRPAAPRFRDPDHEVLARRIRRDVIAAIEAGPGWERVYQPDEDVMLVRVGLLDLDVDPDLGRFTGSSVVYANSAGGAILSFELADSLTGLPIYRYIDRRALPAGTYPGSDVDRQRLAQTFSDFAESLGATLRRNFEILREVERSEAPPPATP